MELEVQRNPEALLKSAILQDIIRHEIGERQVNIGEIRDHIMRYVAELRGSEEAVEAQDSLDRTPVDVNLRENQRYNT